MIREYLEKRRTRRILRKYISEDAVESVMRGTLNVDVHQLKPAVMELVVAVVRGATSEVVSERMGFVADVAIKHGGTVVDLVSSIVIVAYGMFPQQQVVGKRSTLVRELAEQLQENVKIVHCARSGMYGNLGSNARMSYSFVVPGFGEMLGVLASMEFGETRELHETNA